MSPFFQQAEIEALVRAQDVITTRTSGDWRNGLLLGNGAVGAIGYVNGCLEWVINKNDVFDGRVPQGRQLTHRELMDYLDAHNEKESYFMRKLEAWEKPQTLRSVSPLILRLHFGSGELGWSAPAAPAVSSRLSLYEGELQQAARAHRLDEQVESLAPRGTNLFIVKLAGHEAGLHTIELYRPLHDEMNAPAWSHEMPDEAYFTQELPGGIGSYAVAVKLVCEGEVYWEQARFNGKLRQTGDMTLYVSVCSAYEFDDPLQAALLEVRSAARQGFEALREQNRAWWADFWQKSAVDFGAQARLMKYWYFSLYELGCAYGGTPMPPLTGMLYGPLSATTPGVTSANYNSDQNTQIPLMPLPVTNHAELMESVIVTFERAAEELHRHTRELFGGAGILTPLVSNQNGFELGSTEYRYTICGSAYTGLMLCWAWKYTRDERLMKRAYPLLCEFIRFYADNLMYRGADGLYHLERTIPPEIFMFTEDDTATLSMLRVCMETALEFARLTGKQGAELERWADILAHYPPMATHPEGGWWGGPDIPPEHFTFSTHLLYPFFPSERYVEPADREVTMATLRYIEGNAVERVFLGKDMHWIFLHGWSWLLYHMSKLRLGAEENAWKELHEFLDFFAKPNGLFSHNAIVIADPTETEPDGETPLSFSNSTFATPNEESKVLVAPVIEGNSIFLTYAAETLLSSFDGVLRLFPGVGAGATVKFQGLMAQGGFEVSAEMAEGTVRRVCIRSRVGGTLLMEDPWEHTVRSIDTAPGQVVEMGWGE